VPTVPELVRLYREGSNGYEGDEGRIDCTQEAGREGVGEALEGSKEWVLSVIS
jgi:hypothetical protein